MQPALDIAISIDNVGCFAGPDDTLDVYVTKKNKSQNSKNAAPQELAEAFQTRLHVDISQISIEETPKGLMPWELACCWIDEDGSSTIRMRPETTKTTINRTAVLTHELIHAMRGRIGSTTFEEFTAYAVTASLFPHYLTPWRTFLGPLFNSALEVILVIATVWACWLLPFFLSLPVLPFLLLPVTTIALLFLRLFLRWRVWNAAFERLNGTFSTLALPLVVRLSDEEIRWLAMLPHNRVRNAFLERAKKEWRFRLLEKKFLLDLLE